MRKSRLDPGGGYPASFAAAADRELGLVRAEQVVRIDRSQVHIALGVAGEVGHDAIGAYRTRAPLKPISLGSLAALAQMTPPAEPASH